MATTGYSDNFQRTVSGGFGTANSGQTYTVAGGSGAQFSVSAGVGSIAVNNTNGNWFAYVDRQTSDCDITGQVALSAVPSSNLSTVGFTAKQSGTSNMYIGSLMVQSTAIMSLRISRIVSGGLATLNTTLVPGLGTYVAGTYFNLRFQCYWSNLLQTNVLSIKIWAIGTTEPGGWLVSITDSSFTQYTAGTQAGLNARDEATSPGNTARFQNVVARSYNLPMPAATDGMCADPAVAYPKQTALQSLAQAADAAMVTLDPLSSLAALFPRVKISNGPFVNNPSANIPFTAVDYNIGTGTNLGYDPTAIALPIGIWMVMFEIQVKNAASADVQVVITQPAGSSNFIFDMKVSPTHSNDAGVGGSAHCSFLSVSSDPLNNVKWAVGINGSYSVTYVALSALKISDYFS